jgi:hypothetical protein
MMRPTPFVLTLAAAAALAACGPGAKGPDPAKPAPAPPVAAPAPGGALTTAEAVMEASLVAQGGRERIGKVKAIRQTGTFGFPQMGLVGPMVAVSAPPHNTVAQIELKGLGKIAQGVSGDVGWEMSAVGGARLVTGKELAQLKRESAFNAALIWKQLYPKAELAGEADFEGQKAYKIVLTAADGDTQTRYIAKDTLLPIGGQMVMSTQMGELPVEAVDSDWREVGGIKFPHKLVRKQGPQTIEIVVEKIELDPELDPATFALPPEIAALQPKP